MFMNSSKIIKQTFQKVLLPQYTTRKFCCVLSSRFTIPESKQYNKLKINNQHNFQTKWPIYSKYAKFSTIPESNQSSKKPNLTEATKKNLQDDIIMDISQKNSLYEKFKLMYKKYWYVLIPVHVTTSISWVGGFYYMSKSGVDIIALLQSLHVSEILVEKFQDSNMGHYAIAYLCYKIITPIRYAVTLGGTTVSIKYLVKRGYIKPVPTKQEFIKMYEDKKANLKMKRKDKDDESK